MPHYEHLVAPLSSSLIASRPPLIGNYRTCLIPRIRSRARAGREERRVGAVKDYCLFIILRRVQWLRLLTGHDGNSLSLSLFSYFYYTLPPSAARTSARKARREGAAAADIAMTPRDLRRRSSQTERGKGRTGERGIFGRGFSSAISSCRSHRCRG